VAFPALWFAIALRALGFHRDSLLSVRGRCAYKHLRASSLPLYPRGPRSRRVRLSRPSSLNRPHAPHSPAHSDFASSANTKCPRCMSLPRHLSDQPVVPCFHCTFLPSMPPSKTSGSPLGARAQFYPNGIGLAPTGYRLGTPGYPRHPLQTGHASRGFTTVRFRYGLLSCSPL
jgi:hypothetical protein